MISRQAAEIGFASATAVFGAVTMFGASEYGVGWSPAGPEPGTFPFYVGLIILAASIGNIVIALAARAASAADAPFMTRDQVRLVLGFALPIVGLVGVSLLLGLYVGMALYLFGTLVFQNGYGVMKASTIALGVPLGTYLLIEKAFRVGMLKGPLEAALGI